MDRTVADGTKMADVARLAGVSPSTVSRALAGTKGVSEARRAEILRLTAELGYTISPDASRLARGETRRIAVVVRNTETWFYYSVLGAVEPILRAAGLDILFYRVASTDDRDRFFEDLPVRKQVDGVILVGVPLTAQQVERIGTIGVPVVMAGSHIEHFPSVHIDEELAGRQAVEHLLALGHTRIGRIGITDPEGRPWQPEMGRAAGYRQALEAVGIAVDEALTEHAEFSPTGGAQAMERLLARPNPPTAVFAFSDELAIGAIRHGRRPGGPHLPDGVSLIGVDDHPLSELMNLTTVRQPVHEIGEVAAQVMQQALRGEETGDIALPTSVMVRESTRPHAG